MRSISCRSAALAAAAAGAVACALGAPTAHAQERLVTLRLGYAVTWDDNVFRVPDDVTDPEIGRGNAGRSDRFSTASVGLSLNKAFSLQRILLDVAAAAVRYDKFSSQDQDPFGYRGAWQWQLTQRMSGTLSASRDETRVPIEDIEGSRRIDRRVTSVAATADASIWGGWHLLGSVSEAETTYSEPFLAQPDTTQTVAEAGLRYVARSNSQLTVRRRSTRGTETVFDPAIFGGSDFTLDETEVDATWIASGRSTVHARVTWLERSHQLLPQRDFSGTAGELRFAWKATGKVDVNLSATRSIEPYNLSIGSTTRVDDTITAALLWQLGARTALRSTASRRESRFGQPATSSEPARRDITDIVEVGASWSPQRNVTLDARLSHQQRTSTDALQTFDADIASVSVAFTF